MSWNDFDYSIVSLVPCTHRADGLSIGLVLHAPQACYLRAQFATDLSLAEGFPHLNLARLMLYLRALEAVSKGDDSPIGQLPRPERFHWLTAPRSDLLQPGPIHPGRALDLDQEFARIYAREVAR